jgi:hypothetical protein
MLSFDFKDDPVLVTNSYDGTDDKVGAQNDEGNA